MKIVSIVTVTNRFDASVRVTSVDVDVDVPDGLNTTVESTLTDLSNESGQLVAEINCERGFERDDLLVGLKIDEGTVSAEISGDEADRRISITYDEEF
ncbi:hypothetical protein DJ82_11535 [Halorubrum sp. Ib24]|uniref:hypothetical protein n=1 Tax=unclassified Halorubrum TaxID=2642239 RepID=UPI000B98BDE9|nr:MULTISPECIES: hypothetical protein [unclassified Halorubrum]OYR39060.1 hypothetical protein DJ82_11535 [Halorubrum sp. Ib24]OYR45769.1 hypothetical protein DJ75_07115 [Halorubrum sp. Eb13]